MRSTYRLVILQVGVVALTVISSTASTKENYKGCAKQATTDAQLHCFAQIAGDMWKDLKSSKEGHHYKLQYARAILMVNDKQNRHQDDEMLRDRVRAYEGATRIFDSIDAVGDDNWAPRYEALVDYFSRLGPEYKPDADYSRQTLNRERRVAAMQSGESATPAWLTAVQAAVDGYNASRGRAPEQPSVRGTAPTGSPDASNSVSASEGPSSIKNGGTVVQESANASGSSGSNRQGNGPTNSGTAPSGQQNGPPPPRQENDCVQITRKRTDNNYCNGSPALIVEFRNACSTQILFKLCTQHTGGWKCVSGLLNAGEDTSNGIGDCGQYNGNTKYWGYISEPGVNMFNYLPPDPQ